MKHCRKSSTSLATANLFEESSFSLARVYNTPNTAAWTVWFCSRRSLLTSPPAPPAPALQSIRQAQLRALGTLYYAMNIYLSFQAILTPNVSCQPVSDEAHATYALRASDATLFAPLPTLEKLLLRLRWSDIPLLASPHAPRMPRNAAELPDLRSTRLRRQSRCLCWMWSC